jgi:hypothetical protein
MAAYVQSGSQSHVEEVAARIEAGMVAKIPPILRGDERPFRGRRLVGG